MVKILLSGALGHMGRAVAELAKEKYAGQVCITAGVDAAQAAGTDNAGLCGTNGAFPVYSTFEAVPADAGFDAVIDFSHFSLTRKLLEFCRARKLALVLCTTAISTEDLERAGEISKVIPLFRSANMSLGIALVKDLIKRAEKVLGSSFDVEIVERHHRRKVDAPSGTALALAEAVNEAAGGGLTNIYDRASRRSSRPQGEIGISSVRGGNIVGDHDVCFIGDNEIITVSHNALSRSLFADGALRAALFVAGRAPGQYCMDDLLRE